MVKLVCCWLQLVGEKEEQMKVVLVFCLLGSMLFSISTQSFGQEKPDQLIIGNGWELKIVSAFLTKEFGDYTGGINYALPGQSLMILSFGIKYTGSDEKTWPPLQEAKIKDSHTGREVMSKEIGMRKDLSPKKDGSSISYSTLGCPSIRLVGERGKLIRWDEVTQIEYIASVPENKRDLVFEIPGTNRVELQSLLQSQETE